MFQRVTFLSNIVHSECVHCSRQCRVHVNVSVRLKMAAPTHRVPLKLQVNSQAWRLSRCSSVRSGTEPRVYSAQRFGNPRNPSAKPRLPISCYHPNNILEASKQQPRAQTQAAPPSFFPSFRPPTHHTSLHNVASL